MTKPFFSIITPVYLHSEKRRDDFIRCIESLKSQSFKDFEHIVSDDGSPIDCPANESFTLYIRRDDHLERLVALKSAFKHASGEWLCFLDSDDMYLPHTLETMKETIDDNPGYKIFNFGSVHIHPDKGVRVRDSFKPKKLEVGHEVFGGGNIVNGTFIVHRSVWEELGDFPKKCEKLWSPWEFSISAQAEFPELQDMFMVDHEDEPEKIARELGNPWGQDFYLFYKYTRKYHSLPLDKHLYVVYHR